MKLTPVASNMTQVQTRDRTLILFSYSTPVACLTGGTYYKTSKKWSSTTSRHITKWLDGMTAEEKPQEFFDQLPTD